MFQVFQIQRQLHELLWHLREASKLQIPPRLEAEVNFARDSTERLIDTSPEGLLTLDLAARRGQITELLRRVSESARRNAPGPHHEYANADLAGAHLSGRDLRAANLRGALLIGADLRSADLRNADVAAADFRNADLRDANMSTSLFLHQSQLDAAGGDAHTCLPSHLSHPAHWQ
jgi:hypothetical protein